MTDVKAKPDLQPADYSSLTPTSDGSRQRMTRIQRSRHMFFLALILLPILLSLKFITHNAFRVLGVNYLTTTLVIGKELWTLLLILTIVATYPFGCNVFTNNKIRSEVADHKELLNAHHASLGIGVIVFIFDYAARWVFFPASMRTWPVFVHPENHSKHYQAFLLMCHIFNFDFYTTISVVAWVALMKQGGLSAVMAELRGIFYALLDTPRVWSEGLNWFLSASWRTTKAGFGRVCRRRCQGSEMHLASEEEKGLINEKEVY